MNEPAGRDALRDELERRMRAIDDGTMPTYTLAEGMEYIRSVVAEIGSVGPAPPNGEEPK